jgi:hypothetical protein
MARRHFAVLMRSEPLAEPNVLDTFLQPSVVKIHSFDYFLFIVICHLMS